MGNITIAEYVELKRSIYREYSRSYDEDRQRFVSGEALARRIDWALEPLKPGQHLLDLGCGSGELLLAALGHNRGKGRLVGLDLTPEMLALAGTRTGGQTGLIQGNVLDGLPFQDGAFQLVTSLNLVQELPSLAIQPLLAQVYRVLKPGGAFRAVIPCMVEHNAASRAFREMAQRCGAMEFLWPEELEVRLAEFPDFNHREFHVAPSPAAAASGKTRFKFFTNLLEEVRRLGLDPGQVKQGVLFFAARREIAGPE